MEVELVGVLLEVDVPFVLMELVAPLGAHVSVVNSFMPTRGRPSSQTSCTLTRGPSFGYGDSMVSLSILVE